MRKGNLMQICRTVLRVWAVVAVFLPGPIFNLHATDYYIDKDAAGANAGTSWVNAWQSFADINAGTELDQAYAVDQNGVRRPVGAAWDMGALEYCPPITANNLLLLMP